MPLSTSSFSKAFLALLTFQPRVIHIQKRLTTSLVVWADILKIVDIRKLPPQECLEEWGIYSSSSDSESLRVRARRNSDVRDPESLDPTETFRGPVLPLPTPLIKSPRLVKVFM
jgi:hypothetical protein